MPRKKIYSGDETLTYDEVKEMQDKAVDGTLAFVISLIDVAFDGDEDGAAGAKIAAADKITKLSNSSFMLGLLADPEKFVESLPGEAMIGYEGEEVS